MKLIYFLLMLFAVANLVIVIFSGLCGFNIYKKYWKEIIKGLFKFLFLLVVMLIAFAICGISS